MDSKVYLVTGGCGFIGSHLVESLVKMGHKIIVLDNLSTGNRDQIPADVELIEGDIRDQPLLQALIESVDGCYHLAAIASVGESTKNWIGTHQVNLTGTIGLFDAAKKSPIPVVYCSSSAVYGNAGAHPRTEAGQVNPHSPYGADKLACEYHALVGYHLYGISSIGLRLFNIYGPRQRDDSDSAAVIPIFIRRARANEPLPIFGNGHQIRDFVYVRDAVDFLIRSMAHIEKTGLYYGVYNICTGHAVSINHLAKILSKLMAYQLPIQYLDERVGDIQFSLGNPGKAIRDLQLQTKYLLEDGLRELIQVQGP